jgi:succinyl-CoA synthetase beta subunit
MKIHEYQSKEILRKFDVAVPRGSVALSAEEAFAVATELGTPKIVVKAQIHAGGRGKGGGVKIADGPDEVKRIASEMLGMNLVTHQTGPKGRIVRCLLVEEGIDIKRELYLGVVLDRSSSRLVFMASTEGGVEIEKIADETPEKILKEFIDHAVGFTQFQARKLAFGLRLTGDTLKQGIGLMRNLYRAFTESDASLAEINPLIVTGSGDILALDAKITIDDNALYRHPEIVKLRDKDEEDTLEVEARKFGLNYIKLDGNVGCMVNGAGLAMATMDIIKLAGAAPANFLDVGGVANVETVKNGFIILMSDPNVKAVLVNIFGGIVRCDRVANGIKEALSQIEVNVPVVVRLQGNNAEVGAKILEKSDLEFIVAKKFQECAEKVVASLDEK